MGGERLILIIDEDTISRMAMNQTPTKRPQLEVLDSDSYPVPKIDGLKINQPVELYLVVGIAAICAGIMTVGYQAYRAAQKNPVIALRNE